MKRVAVLCAVVTTLAIGACHTSRPDEMTVDASYRLNGALLPQNECDPAKNATIPKDDVGQSLVYGSGSHAIPVRAVKKSAHFATECAVPMGETMGPVKECVPDAAEKIDFHRKEMLIDASFHMVLRDIESKAIYDESRMTETSGKYLAGNSEKFKRKYFVVFHDSLASGDPTRDLDKTYWLLVFYQNPDDDTYACGTSMPSSGGGSGQGGVGGGTEPGHH